jgi:beta-glucanase (GH16 family)
MAALTSIVLAGCQTDNSKPLESAAVDPTTSPVAQPSAPSAEAGIGQSASSTQVPRTKPKSAPTPTPGTQRAVGPSGFAQPSGDLAQWRLVHVDGFDRDTIRDEPYTVYDNGVSGDKPDTSYWKRDHVFVENGRLVLLGERERVTVDGKTSDRLVTGAITLWLLPKQTYGRYEVAVRIDRTPAMSYAWLLWPYDGDNWPQGGEVDFAEDHGGDRSSTRATYNYGDDGVRRTLRKYDISPSRPFSSWHVIGVEWLPGKLRYLLDGKVWATHTSPVIADNPMVLVLQTEGMLPDPPAGRYRAEIDWVAVYARK